VAKHHHVQYGLLLIFSVSALVQKDRCVPWPRQNTATEYGHSHSSEYLPGTDRHTNRQTPDRCITLIAMVQYNGIAALNKSFNHIRQVAPPSTTSNPSPSLKLQILNSATDVGRALILCSFMFFIEP